MLSDLKKARIEGKITIEEAAEQLNIRKKYLIALEEGDLASIPGEVYINGYLKLYAKYLKIEIPNINIDNHEKLMHINNKKDHKFKIAVMITSLLMLLIIIITYPLIIQYGT